LLPIMSSTGRGADVMVPMAIPSLGGMIVALITMFVVPVLTSIHEEIKVQRSNCTQTTFISPTKPKAPHPES
jgi:Cu(I)/Ag(I) efflux system membrane protein CusA/SilA